jgi:hypothetical protein
MRRGIVMTVALAATLILARPTPALAEPMWSYSWQVDPTVLPTQTGGVVLTALSPGSSDLTSLTVDVASVSLFKSLDPSATESLSAAGLGFSLLLKNETTGDSTDLTFGGSLSGSFSDSGVSLSAAFNPAQTAVLGGTMFSVQLTSFDPPGLPGLGVNGTIRAQFSLSTAVEEPPVNEPPVNEPPVQAPEPGSLLLAALAVPCLWAARRRRSRP